MKEEEKRDFKELRWIRLFSPLAIPPYLVEQVKGRDFEVEDFYKLQEMNCLMQGKDGPTLNPLNHLYALVNKKNTVKGFLWAIIDPLSKDLVINTFSIANDYWHQGGGAFEKVSSFVKEMKEKLKIKKVYWITPNPNHAKKHGFKPSRSVLMEYQDEEVNKDGKNI